MRRFPVEKVTDHITRIYAFGSELMYLVTGNDKAALLDTGSGFGSLKACVSELTDKPVIVLLTHGHTDHAFGAGEFDEVYMNHEDDYVYRDHGDVHFRLDGLSMSEIRDEFTMDDFIPAKPLEEIHDLKEGDVFDLGGIHIDVYACAGHTKGSLAFLIREERLLVTGDACNPNTFLFEWHAASVETLRNSLIALKEKTDGKYDDILLSHGNGKGYPELIEDVIGVCDSILKGTAEQIPMEFRGHCGLIARNDPEHLKGNIVYSLNNLWEKQSMKAVFDKEKYEVCTLTMDGTELKYRAFKDIPYVQNPADEEMQKLNIFVPEAFYEGKTINGYDLYTAPIFMPNSVGGYMPGPREVPGLDFMGRVNSIFRALVHGYVVVSPGVRGRGMKNEKGEFIGIAPADIVDLKAAVRFLRHFSDRIPGDKEKIITNGTSAGGAMSSLQASTGNHPDYLPYLREIGAYEERDNVFAGSCYCPITNLDHADMAYEWEFNGLNDYHFAKMVPPREKGQKPEFIQDESVMDENQQRLSDLLAPAFPEYLSSLNLKDNEGNALTLDEKGEGSFITLIKNNILASAAKEMAKGTDLEADDKVTAWLTFENGRPVSVDWKGFIKYRTRMKTAPAFDNVSMGTPENELFGTKDIQFRHFTDFSAEQDPEHGPKAEDIQIKMMNPMYYIDDPEALKAKHVRIRHGAADRDTSLAVSNMLERKLHAAGVDTDIAHPWGIPHAGDYDLDELFAWIDRVVKE